ncbi:MAG: Flp pilus assembly protein CpaB [Gemmataceae bacterium]|nr:Flp pilus assembly protein CpaB [Gemmataceae bacterium]
MKPKTMVLMVVAVVCGLGASYLTSRLLAERDDQPTVQQVEIPKLKVLVAKKYLPQGEMLKNPVDLFVVKEFTRDSVPQEAILDLKDLKGKTLRRPVSKDVWVTPELLADGPLSLEVPPGHFAVGLRVTLDASASGFASLPGSRVDIIWNRKGNNDDTTFSKLILQNVLVLAADTTDIAQGARAIPASVVTLALTSEDARRVSLASENGSMRLILRPPGDNTIHKDRLTLLSDEWKKDREETRKPKEAEKVAVEPAPKFVPDIPPVGGKEPELLPFPQEDNRRRHVVVIRRNNQERREEFWLDDQGRVIEDDPPSARSRDD